MVNLNFKKITGCRVENGLESVEEDQRAGCRGNPHDGGLEGQGDGRQRQGGRLVIYLEKGKLDRTW